MAKLVQIKGPNGALYLNPDQVVMVDRGMGANIGQTIVYATGYQVAIPGPVEAIVKALNGEFDLSV